MNDNPYTPPASLTEDTASPTPDDSPPPERPRQVVQAVGLELMSWGLAFLYGYIEMRASRAEEPDSGREFDVAAALLFLALIALIVPHGWILHRIWLGRNWARVTHLLMVVLLPFIFGSGEPSYTLVGEILDYVMWAVEAVVLGLLFLSPGRKWFRRRRTVTALSS